MRVAYLVLSHRSPEQVLRLVAALREGPSAEVVVRHDQRSSHLPPDELRAAGAHPLADELAPDWGSFAFLAAVLRALAWTLERLDPDWLLVLSGQDYPLRPLADTEAWLAGADEDAFLHDVQQLDLSRPPEPPAEEFFLRYAYRHYPAPSALPAPPRALRPLVYRRELPGSGRARLGVRRARLPFSPDRPCFVSADWPTLSRRAAARLVEVALRDRRLVRHYRRCIVPSESFYATVLLNAPDLRVGTDDRRFVRFAGHGSPHPEVLTSADLETLLSSGMHFARKFDSSVDAALLDALDERRLARSGGGRGPR